MNEIKKHLIDLINEAKEEIESEQKNVDRNKEIIDKIKKVKAELVEIEKALSIVKKDISNKSNILKDIVTEVSDIKSEVILNDQEKIFEVIKKNLPDDMSLKDDEDDELIKMIFSQNKRIGSIEIIKGYDCQIRIKAEVYNNTEDFIVQDPLKVYNIISFIITKFNYKDIQLI